MQINGCHMPQEVHEDRLLVVMASAPPLSLKHRSLIPKDFQFTGLQVAACEHNVVFCCLVFVYNLLGALVYSSVHSTG